MTRIAILLIIGCGGFLGGWVFAALAARWLRLRRLRADPYAAPFGDAPLPLSDRCICHEHHPVCICRPSASAPAVPS